MTDKRKRIRTWIKENYDIETLNKIEEGKISIFINDKKIPIPLDLNIRIHPNNIVRITSDITTVYQKLSESQISSIKRNRSLLYVNKVSISDLNKPVSDTDIILVIPRVHIPMYFI